MRGYYGYRRKSRFPLLLFMVAAILVLGFAGRWGWKTFLSASDEVQTVEIDNTEIERSMRINAIVASNDISEEQYWLRICKTDYILELFKGKELEKQFPIAVGAVRGDKQRSGDDRTPEGVFPVKEIQNSVHWVHDFGDGKGPIEGAYGPFFIRLETGWDGIGIHGTHDPSSIGSDITAGCVRMLNDDVSEIVSRINEGSLVVIEN